MRATKSIQQYEYEPYEEEDVKRIAAAICRKLIYSALLDAKASEHAARMTAMRNATDNANEMIDRVDAEI